MPIFSKEAGSKLMHLIGVEKQEAELLGVGWPETWTPGSLGKDRLGFWSVPGMGTELQEPMRAIWQLYSRISQSAASHHPLPFGAHTYSAPDSVCGSEAGGLWREEGGGRRKAGRECPGAWPGRRVGAAVVGGTRVPSPLTQPVQAGGRAAGSLPRASRLLSASAALRASAILGLRASQRAGRRQPCPWLHLSPP